MLKFLEINGFKSFANKSQLSFNAAISAIVGPNGSGKSNAAEAFRFVLGEQSLKTLRARNSDDLLYNGGHEGQRRNRASVKAVFDNSDGLLDIDYKEVTIERLVQRGDASTYRVNGSQVRLKDVVDLLADANIGTSRHHIISQGESDRILNVHERERKSIIEDALGLGRFYRRRKEALQKLDRTQKNLAEIESHRQELLPALRFLTKQKERIEETKKLRAQLTERYQQFFRRESLLVSHREVVLAKKIADLSQQEAELGTEIADTERILADRDADRDSGQTNIEIESAALEKIEKELEIKETELSTTVKNLGQVEGQLSALEGQQKVTTTKVVITNAQFNKYKDVFSSLVKEEQAVDTDNERLGLFDKIVETIKDFLTDFTEEESVKSDDDKAMISQLKQEKIKLEEEQQKLAQERIELRERRKETQVEQKTTEYEQHEAEKRFLELSGRRKNVSSELEHLHQQRDELQERKEHFDDEKSEARILCGKEALDIKGISLVDAAGEEVSTQEFLEYTSRREQQEFNRGLERLKIRLENTRVSDQTDVMTEFERVGTRISFLEKEIGDLQESKDSLLVLINEIEETVTEKFTAGVKQINKAFNDFFQTMFGGGSAKIFVTTHPEGKRERLEDSDENDEDIDTEEGVAINVALPRKKIHGLGVLSGGERSLVSIALLFALSQINPPPFIVLDEADAALDEANSRRFGDMIHKLSKRSQLIIITHNRETMSRADILYGVTMDQAGGSRLLSLNFDDAVNTVKE